MSIKIMATNYGSSASSASSSSSSSKKASLRPPATPSPSPWNTPTSNTWQTTAPAQPGLGQPQQYQQYHSPINEYENATPNLTDPSGYRDVPPSPTTAELSNASSYISYLVEQLNKAKEKLEKAEEKIKILEGKDDSFIQYKEYIISSIDKFLAERTDAEAISGKEIFEQATK